MMVGQPLNGGKKGEHRWGRGSRKAGFRAGNEQHLTGGLYLMGFSRKFRLEGRKEIK